MQVSRTELNQNDSYAEENETARGDESWPKVWIGSVML